MRRTKVYSIAKVNFTSKNGLSIKWLDEEVFYLLLDENMIKIKGERDDHSRKILLMSSSEELVKFI